MPNGNASVRYFRTRLPLFPALRRWVWERTNSNASVRRFRTTLPILCASAAGMGENEQQCFRPAVPDNASHTLRFGGGYGRERTAMLPSGGSGQRFPYSSLLRRVRERTNGSFLSGGSGQGFPYSAFGGGYGRERTAMSLFGGSGQGFPYSAFGGGYGRERTAMSLFGGSGRGLN